MKKIMAAVVAAILVIGWSVPLSRGQEHPAEHPTGAAKSAVTLEDVAKHIESYVKQGSKDGTFKIEDKKAGKQLSLTLDRVHRERLSQIGPDMFFVCADFKSGDGKLYDLDFFVQGKSNKTLKVVDGKTSVHKEDGKERYTWALNSETGHWEQKALGAQAEEHPGHEHPDHEHPTKEHPKHEHPSQEHPG